LEEAAQQITDKISISGDNKIKRLGAKISRKNRDLRFNNNPEALIFRSFDQAKEQRFHLKINHFRITTNLFHLQIITPKS
jgi:hypothetical protein